MGVSRMPSIDEYDGRYDTIEVKRLIAKQVSERVPIDIIVCPSCSAFTVKGPQCGECHRSIETGIPICQECGEEKMHSDKREEWLCPQCHL